jgi:hypothetical protein
MSMRPHLLVIALTACPEAPQTVPPRPPAPEISVSPASLDFGEQAVDAMGPGRDVMIRNLGDAPLDVYEISLAEPADAFSVGLGWGGTGVRIPAGLGRSFVVRFRPVAPGPYETALKIVSNDSPRGQEIVIPVVGVGVTAELDVVEELRVVEPSAPARLELELRNAGAAVLSIERFNVAGSPKRKRGYPGMGSPGTRCCVTAPSVQRAGRPRSAG